MADGAAARRHQGCAVIAPELTARAEATHPELSDEQRVLRRLLGSGDGVEVIVAAAGTARPPAGRRAPDAGPPPERTAA